MMEQRPVPCTSMADEYTYGTNPSDWHETFLAIVKGLLIIMGLALSAYFLYGIITS